MRLPRTGKATSVAQSSSNWSGPEAAGESDWSRTRADGSGVWLLSVNVRLTPYKPRPKPAGREARRILYLRSEAVRRYVLARAEGSVKAAINQLHSSPLVVSHTWNHTTPGASVTAALISAVVGAVCPNCHREIHHGLNGSSKNDALVAVIQNKEAAGLSAAMRSYGGSARDLVRSEPTSLCEPAHAGNARSATTDQWHANIDPGPPRGGRPSS